jgi:hypothetical protein
MTTILICFLIGTILTFWGGYDFAQYRQSNTRGRLISAVFTTVIGVLNLLTVFTMIQ